MNTNGRILIVEDHLPLLYGLQDILEREGYTVFIAIEAEQAMEMMVGVRPDLILSDLLLPRMDGCSLCAAIRARQEWAAIPFIIVSAQSQRSFVSRAERVGVDGYIV